MKWRHNLDRIMPGRRVDVFGELEVKPLEDDFYPPGGQEYGVFLSDQQSRAEIVRVSYTGSKEFDRDEFEVEEFNDNLLEGYHEAEVQLLLENAERALDGVLAEPDYSSEFGLVGEYLGQK